ncbi:hypothetical protein BBM20_14170 [Vibrio parahaemolyticus]|uniref:beta family protein n=1 Tax=Vibrio parahaemolyticus TaxID=670 RepID=UPI00084ADB49|nr:beta family protein [Vibrio parahaemolyticus]EJC7014810.1 beta family protein [Vibrio parahaemolyticus]ODY29516.1 hypothetical protein BBM20_14170 [Vibrio parahaemolyticus]
MNFSQYKYIPTLRTRASEMLGVEKLSDSTKEKILPFVCLSKVNRIASASGAFDKWHSAFDKPAILGLSEDKRLQVEDYAQLMSSEDGFSAWATFFMNAKKVNDLLIPSLILNKDVGKRDFVKQLQRFESEFGKVVLRVNPLHRREVAAAMTAASIIDSTDNILFILDAGQISREHQKAILDATIHALNELRLIDPRIEVVTTSSSFPRMFQSYTQDHDGKYGEIPMLEWENYHALGGQNIAIYGDYAGIHGEFYEGSYAKFVARVDYPTPATWIFERRRQVKDRNAADVPREKLYSRAARGIITSESWDDSLDVWGAKIIREAANNQLEKFGTPAKWISVRLNLHIERITRFLDEGVSIPQDSLDDDDWDKDEFDW